MTRAGHEPQDAAALLVIDMVSTWEFDDAEPLREAAAFITPAVAALRMRCREAGVPVIYANDNHGHWRSDWHHLMDSALQAGGQGAWIARELMPAADDYFVLKPMHSAFFATPLQLLLQHLEVGRLILTGVSSDQCVLATALTAKMEGYAVCIPTDAVATQTAQRAEAAVRYFEDVLRLQTCMCATIPLP